MFEITFLTSLKFSENFKYFLTFNKNKKFWFFYVIFLVKMVKTVYLLKKLENVIKSSTYLVYTPCLKY